MNSINEANSAANQADIDRIVRKKELTGLLGVSITTIYRWIKTEGLPKPLKLGANSVGWRLSEVQAWLDSRERDREVG